MSGAKREIGFKSENNTPLLTKEHTNTSAKTLYPKMYVVRSNTVNYLGRE